jgi:tryptophan halogenase
MSRPSRIVVVGRDADLWLTAAALGEALRPAGVTIAAIELPSRLGPASVYTGWPAIEALHAKLGIDEAALLRSTDGSFSLGCNVVPGGGLAPFFLAHGAYGTPIDGGDFFGHWVKARRFGLGAALEDFSPTAMAARHGRMLLPDAETETFGRTDYGYHLPAIAYAALLKARAHRLGVALHQALAVAVERDPETGEIRTIVPDGGEALAGDLFVDASGDEAVLIGQALDVAIDDWRPWLPLDRRLVARAERFKAIPAYAELRLGNGNWTALHATQAATHVVHAFASAEQSDEAALADASRAAGLPLADAIVAPVAPGRRRAAWAGNCVAIGSAACALDSLFDLDLHVVQLGLVHLLALLSTSDRVGPERAEYNRVTASLFDRLRDVSAAVHALGQRAHQTSNLPETLTHKLQTFRARGTIAAMEGETFTDDQWRALLVGFGVMPESWPPALDSVPPDRIKQGFRRILGFVHDTVTAQPAHDAYLAELTA